MNKEILNEKIEEVERGFQPYLPTEEGYQKTVLEAMNYSLLAGGKRLRPLFMKEMYEFFGGNDEAAIRPFMMALEMIHTYSLVHDDLPAMDNDDYRRGKLTTHKKYGEDMGILTGDALLNMAFETAFLAFDSDTDAALVGRALKVLGNKAGIYGMIGGQVVDVENDGKFVSEDTLYFVYKNKTSALIESAFMIGAILAGASEEDIALAEELGTSIGLAFQIQDDILDETGTQEVIGKPVHSDEKNEKSTYLAIYGMELSVKKVKEYTETGLQSLEKMKGCKEENKIFLRELMISLIGREK